MSAVVYLRQYPSGELLMIDTMMLRNCWLRILSPFLAVLIVAGCASGPDPATVIRTTHNAGIGPFTNLLVISVAGDYASRAAYERQVATGIVDEGGNASPYYGVIGRRPQFNRSHILDAVVGREFDAVLFTRLKGQEQAEFAPGRPVGGAFDLFGYDYPELINDVAIQQADAITFVVELYDTSTQAKVWAIDALSLDAATIEALIDQQVVTVVQKLTEDNLIGR